MYTNVNGNWFCAIIFHRHFGLMRVYKYISHRQRLVVAIMKNLSVVQLCDMANTMVVKLLSLICTEKRMLGRQELVLLWYLLCYTNLEACSTVSLMLQTFSWGHIYVFTESYFCAVSVFLGKVSLLKFLIIISFFLSFFLSLSVSLSIISVMLKQIKS